MVAFRCLVPCPSVVGELGDTVECQRSCWSSVEAVRGKTEEFQAKIRAKIGRLVNGQSGGHVASSVGGEGACLLWEIRGGTRCRSLGPLGDSPLATTTHNHDLRYWLSPFTTIWPTKVCNSSSCHKHPRSSRHQNHVHSLGLSMISLLQNLEARKQVPKVF